MADEVIVKPPEQQSKEELAQSIAAESARIAAEKPQPAAEPEKPKPQPKSATQTFEYKASDGTTYTAESNEELFRKVTGALDQTKAALKDREWKLHEFKAQKPPDPAPKKEEFDKQKYYALVDEDPLKAQEYLDKHREQPEWAKTAAEVANTVKTQQQYGREAVAFYATPAGQQYAQIETPELNTKILEYMKENGMSYSADNLERAFYRLKEAGELKMPEAPKPRPKAPPASPQGDGADTPTLDKDLSELYRMPKEKLAEYLQSKGLTVTYAGR